MMKDILESGLSWQDKSYCMTARYDGDVLWNTLERSQRSMVAEPESGARLRKKYRVMRVQSREKLSSTMAAVKRAEKNPTAVSDKENSGEFGRLTKTVKETSTVNSSENAENQPEKNITPEMADRMKRAAFIAQKNDENIAINRATVVVDDGDKGETIAEDENTADVPAEHFEKKQEIVSDKANEEKKNCIPTMTTAVMM